jgi:hypothetical protein
MALVRKRTIKNSEINGNDKKTVGMKVGLKANEGYKIYTQPGPNHCRFTQQNSIPQLLRQALTLHKETILVSPYTQFTVFFELFII